MVKLIKKKVKLARMKQAKVAIDKKDTRYLLKSEHMKRKQSGKLHALSSHQYTVSNQQNLKCPICLQKMVQPTLTYCGHTFCLYCLEELFFQQVLMKRTTTCPICRHFLFQYDSTPSKVLIACIDTYNAFADNIHQNEFNERKASFLNLQKRRKPRIQLGNVLYFFVSNRKSIFFGWQIGRIRGVYKFTNQKYISVELIWKYGSFKKIVYSFHQDSRKIADLQYFASKEEMYLNNSNIFKLLDELFVKNEQAFRNYVSNYT